MRRIRVDPAAPDSAVIREAAGILRDGGLVAFPTETVYGLGANAFDAAAVRRIFDAKARPGYNPLIVHVPNEAHAAALARGWPPEASRLAAAFWPGPLTLVVRKVETIPDEVTAGLPTVGLRVPAHPVALALLWEVELPLAAPSANPFASISPTTGAHVEAGLGHRVDLLLDAGPTPIGIESAVVVLSGQSPVLLRPGSIPAERLSEVAGALDLNVGPEADGAPQRAPGMLRRHYAPKGVVRLFSVADRELVRTEVDGARAAGQRVGALLLKPFAAAVDHPILMSDEAEAYARQLYAALHSLERSQCDLILIEQVPETPEWRGIRDRLSRAAAE